MAEQKYDASTIHVLKGLEAVQKRPAMYIGDIGIRGLHHLVYEVVDNCIDEIVGGHANKITLVINKDETITIEDNGRGIPVDIHKDEKRSALEVVMTVLHAGGKFEKDAYKVSGGLHGVGVSVVNALSEWLAVEVRRDGKIYKQEYQRGFPKYPVKIVGEYKTGGSGTKISFLPDNKIFKNAIFKFDILEERIRELAYLNRHAVISMKDERDNEEREFHFKGGIVEFVQYLDEARAALHKTIFVEGEKESVPVEVAFQYNEDFSENMYSYVNNINTHEGGTHLIGFKSALTKSLNNYAIKNNLIKSEKLSLTGEDFREGLTCIISVKVQEPQFEGQTKTKLGNSEVKSIVETLVYEKLSEYLEENPSVGKKIIEKCVRSAEAREAARKARDLARRKNALDNLSLPGKLADCSNTNPEFCEMYIVEGDSAGGSAKQGRDRRFQAILPLRGKILNVEKVKSLSKILENNEIKSLVAAIGGGIGIDFDHEKARYGKIIIMTDADVDGSHIRTLLLTFFYRYMQNLINAGKIFIAQPPLYKVKKGREEHYAYDEEQRDEIIKRYKGEKSITTNPDQVEMDDEGTPKGIVISRYKGLGEMNPSQLWTTTMDPEKRTLLQVNMESAATADKIFEVLMGDEVEPRKQFIEKNAKYVKNLDV